MFYKYNSQVFYYFLKLVLVFGLFMKLEIDFLKYFLKSGVGYQVYKIILNCFLNKYWKSVVFIFFGCYGLDQCCFKIMRIEGNIYFDSLYDSYY